MIETMRISILNDRMASSTPHLERLQRAPALADGLPANVERNRRRDARAGRIARRETVWFPPLSVARSVLLVTTLVLVPPVMLPAADGAGTDFTAVATPWLAAGTIAGAVVLVTDCEQTLLCEAAGSADVSTARPMATDSLFWIASMTKPMTAAALMMLVDERKVGLDEAVAGYLPELGDFALKTGAKPARRITVRDLLAHTSGLPFMSPAETPTLDRLPLADAVRSYADLQLLFEPGKGYQYSNAGINTAGRVIEVVSGMPFERFLETRLFRPLGMRDTTFRPSPDQVARVASSYRHRDDGSLEAVHIQQLQYPLAGPGRFPMPGGGLFSTADDCGRFCRMLLCGGMACGVRILSADAVSQMRTRQTPETVKEAYGLGVQIRPDGRYGHGGAYATDLLIDDGRGLATVWLVQDADPKKPSQACRDAVVAWLDKKPWAPAVRLTR